MDYQAIAQSILQGLPEPDMQPVRRSWQSDDERIAKIAWTRMKLMHAEQASGGVRYMSLI